MTEFHQIAKIISASLFRELKDNEKNILDQWLLNENNKSIYTKICNEKTIIKAVDDKLKIDYISSYLNIDKLIYKRKKKKIFYSILRYAAIILIPLFVGILYFDNSQFKFKDSSRVQICDIKPGYSKAKLILDDGRVLDIEKLNTDTIIDKRLNIEASNTTINYSSSVNVLEKEIYNTLITPKGGEYKLVLSDGTTVQLNSGSVIKFPVKFRGNDRRVFLTGEAFFVVAKNVDKPFIINVRGREVKVLGTSFNLRAYSNEGNIFTTLLEGSVEIRTNKSSSIIKPGQQSVISEDGSIANKNVEVSLYTSWKDGKLRFKHQSLEEIMNTIYRWYDVDVVFYDESVKNIKFSGTIRKYNTFEEVIKFIQLTGKVNFEIRDKTIYIRSK